MFRLSTDPLERNYYKIGRTKDLPSRRMEAWPGSILLKSWRCRKYKMAETLLHWLFDKSRLIRYVSSTDKKSGLKTLLTARWSSKGTLLHDHIHNQLTTQRKSTSTVRKTREIEWFCMDKAAAEAVITAVTLDINLHWKEEKWPKLMEQMK